MKHYSTKRALIASVIVLAICFSTLVGTTYAWFTDSVSSSGNVIQSGNLDVKLLMHNSTEYVDISEAEAPIFGDEDDDSLVEKWYGTNVLWEPGKTQIVYLAVENAGSLALKYNIIIDVVDNGLVGSLDYAILDGVKVGDVTPGSWDDICNVSGAQVGLIAEGRTIAAENGAIVAGADARDYFALAIHMQEEAGNNYQDKNIVIDINIVATQLANESDSFGTDYDKDAPCYNVSDYEEIPEEGVTGDVTLYRGRTAVKLPANLVNSLPEEVEKLALAYVDPDITEDGISFPIVDIIDQNGDKIDLSSNTVPVSITLSVGDHFDAGEQVFIYHDGKFVDTAYVNADGTVTYESLHFCEVSIATDYIGEDCIYRVSNADELISILTDIKTEAKKQIPGAEGNKNYRENAIIILENDIVIDSADNFMYTDSNGAPLHFYGVKGVLDLNGHSIKVTKDALLGGKAHANAVLLVQYSNLTIIGEGSVIAENKSIPVYGWANSTIDIYGGNYITNASERNESAVYVNNATVLINVYGGNYTDSAYSFNVHDNCKNTTTIVLYEGITYEDFYKGTVDLIAADISNGRIAIADGCVLEEYVENGADMNKVVKN